MRGSPWLLAAVPLLAQQQPTFQAAWQDGLEAERAERWTEAAGAYRRARELRPRPAARVVTYGNNLLFDYYPRTRLARCLVELGDLAGAEAELRAAEGEPAEGRDALAARIRELRARKAPGAEPLHAPAPALHPPAPAPAPSVETRPMAEPLAAPPSEPAPREEARREEMEVPAPESPAQRPAPEPPLAEAPPAAQGLQPLHLGPAGWGLLAMAGLAGLAGWFRLRTQRSWRGRGSSAPAPGSAPPPAEVGPYRIERLLGRGGFADTFLARHRTTGTEVALKVPHPHRTDDPEFRARFRLEARLGSRLDHPHLVRILDPGPEEGLLYLAMEFLPGQRLDERLRAQGALPLAEALCIARQVAEAMAYAHTHGVVHRDLKPGNLLLTEAGVKVMDLGIARVMDADTVTTTYAFLGTPLYAAPEVQLRTHVGPAADRYSLGVILYHLLAGEPPFQGETPFEILDRHRSSLPPDLRLRRPEAPPALLSLVARLLDKEPDQRPEDGEIIRVLTELEAALPPSIPGPPAAPPRD